MHLYLYLYVYRCKCNTYLQLLCGYVICFVVLCWHTHCTLYTILLCIQHVVSHSLYMRQCYDMYLRICGILYVYTIVMHILRVTRYSGIVKSLGNDFRHEIVGLRLAKTEGMKPSPRKFMILNDYLIQRLVHR